MPELPDPTVYLEALDRRIVGERLAGGSSSVAVADAGLAQER